VTITDDPAKVQYDLQSILTHEVGHFIGIAHSPDPGAVMFASYAPGSTAQRELHPDDIEAVCAIYPSTSEAPCNTEPRGGFGPRCDDPEPETICSIQPGGGASYSVAMIFLGSGFLAARARRRRAAKLSSERENAPAPAGDLGGR
jgi:hypothetical protein